MEPIPQVTKSKIKTNGETMIDEMRRDDDFLEDNFKRYTNEQIAMIVKYAFLQKDITEIKRKKLLLCDFRIRYSPFRSYPDEKLEKTLLSNINFGFCSRRERSNYGNRIIFLRQHILDDERKKIIRWNEEDIARMENEYAEILREEEREEAERQREETKARIERRLQWESEPKRYRHVPRDYAVEFHRLVRNTIIELDNNILDNHSLTIMAGIYNELRNIRIALFKLGNKS